MGVLTSTLLHTLTDKLAAYTQANLDGIIAERASQVNPGLAAALDDGSSDPVLQAALLAYCNAVDLGSRPANRTTALLALLAQGRYADLAAQLRAYVVGAGGGSYASFAAYLSDVSAHVHPLAAEVLRHGQGSDPFLSSGRPVGVFAPNYVAQFAKRVYTGADGSLVDDTTDAGDVGTADVALFAADDDALYVGADDPFTMLIVALSTAASVDCALTFQYWNGAAWATLTVTDHSEGMTRNGPISWTAPSDWSPCHKDAGGTAFADQTPRYYIRLARTEDTVLTPPVATCLTIVPAAVVTGDYHLGVPQPPLAIVEVLADSSLDVTRIVDPDDARFELPGDGAGVSLVRLRALTVFGGTLTPTVSYTDQGDAASTQAQAAWNSPAALATVAVDLGADTGLKAILETAWAVTTALTEGVFAVEVAELRTPAL